MKEVVLHNIQHNESELMNIIIRRPPADTDFGVLRGVESMHVEALLRVKKIGYY